MQLTESAMDDDEDIWDDISGGAYAAMGKDMEYGFKRRWLHQNAEQRPKTPRKAEKYLSEREMKYLLEGDAGDDTASRIENEIENKSQGLRTRVHRLLNDIALLDYGDYIDADDESWENLTHTEGPAFDRRFVGDITELELTSVGYGSKSVALGYDLGVVFRILAGPAYENTRAADFLWGILLANCATTSGKVSAEENNYEIIEQKLDKRSREHFQTAISVLSKEEQIDQAKGPFRADDLIKSVASQFDIEPSVHLDLFIKTEATQPRFNDGEVKYMSEIDYNPELVQRVIKDCLDKEPLKSTTAITSGLSTEWENIEKASAPGVTAGEILEAVWEQDGLSSDDIAKEISPVSSVKYSKQVTQTLNKLSKDGKIPYPDVTTTYRHAPLVEWYSPEERSGKWELTAYGRLFCRFVFDEGRDVKTIHRKLLSNHNQAIDPTIDSHFENLKQDIESVMRGGKEILESND